MASGRLLVMMTLIHRVILADQKLTSKTTEATNTIHANHPFLSVETSCSPDSLLIMASLSEPFYGQLYAKGYATTPTCRVEGGGNRLLKLALNVSECGIRFIQMDDGSRQLDLSLYVQYDRHVQQAVDEQIQSRCRISAVPADPEQDPRSLVEESPRHNSVHFLTTLDKLARRSDVQENGKNVLVTVRPTSPTLAIKTLSFIQGQKFNLTTTRAPTTPTTVPTRAPVHETVSCWMDIVAGTDPNSRPVDTYLRVGQEATLVVKVRQPAGLDTRLTSCVAHDGSHDSQQELLDTDGCTVDSSILPNVLERTNTRSGIKLLYANFQAFKFPDRDHLHFKCTVVVCKGKCQLNTCNLIRRKGRDVKAVGTISVETQPRPGIMRVLNVRDLKETMMQPVPVPARYKTNSTSGTRSSQLRSSNLTNLIKTLQNYGAAVDRVDVFNSVEVRAPQLEETNGPVKGTRPVMESSEGSDPFISSEAIFCLTPSKLFLAFGVLFALLISAMLLAVCICIRVKSKREKKRLLMVRSQQPRYLSGPPPVSAVNPTYAMRANLQSTVNRHPQQHQTQIQRQLSRHNSASPYYRVFQ